ncbi:MAG: hypothetical protein PQJ58_15110 [Spirochaetales bacterium]|nr:hypothetical protein [Spirochaetales bacterium]
MNPDLELICGPIRLLIRLDYDHQDILDFIYSYTQTRNGGGRIGPIMRLAEALDKLLEAGIPGTEISDYAYEYVEGVVSCSV